MNENKEKKIRKKEIIFGGILLIAFVLIGTIAFTFISIKPKKVFMTAIDRVYSYSKEKNKQINRTSGKFSLKSDLHSNNSEDEKILKILNNLDLSYNYIIDSKNKKMYVEFDSNFKNKELLKASFSFENEKAYVFLNDVYNKHLEVPTTGINEMLNTLNNLNEYEVILKQIKEALQKSLKEEYFKKETTYISLNGKREKVTENKLILNKRNIKEITTVLSNELNNKEFIQSVAKISLKTEEEIKESLNSLKKEFSNLKEETLTVSIYTKGFKKEFAGIAFKNEKNEITFLKKNKTNYTFEIQNNQVTYKGTIEINENNAGMNLKISFDSKGTTGSIVFNFENTTIDFPIIKTDNVLSIETLSEKDSMEIIKNIQKKEGVLELIQAITSLYSSNLKF